MRPVGAPGSCVPSFCLLVLVIGYLAVTAVQVWLTSRHSEPRPAQAVVVMGAAQYDGVPSPIWPARLEEADDSGAAVSSPSSS